MRTRINGRLSELGDTEATIDVGAFSYAVYVSSRCVSSDGIFC